LAPELHDDGFHEIQLNGKQLVFLFMAATVVSVVIFLCGVLVGRGVKTERAVSSADAAAVAAVADPTLPQTTVTTPPAAGTDPTAAAPPPAVGELTYSDRLEKKTEPPEQLKQTAAPALPAQRSHEAFSTAAAPAVPSSAVKAQSPSAGPGDGWSIQVAAVPEHDADTIAKHLTSKGYGSVFVVAPGGTARTLYRVRVGRFKTHREAETVASRLQKEEQFKTWIIR
jgi:cell division septation protein DedD